VSHAFLWDKDSGIKDLGTLGGDSSEAIWLNEAGDVVGSADLSGPSGNQAHDAVIWRSGKIHDLGTIPGDPCSRGRGLNSRGQVVGGEDVKERLCLRIATVLDFVCGGEVDSP
jgi:uncharacterized membrane protein